MFKDPDWFFWAVEEGVFENKSNSILEQAEDLYKKATHIKIPNNPNGNLAVEYTIHPPTGKFSSFEIVPGSRPLHKGSSPAFRSKTIDMSAPRRIAKFDKLGCRNLLTSLKYYIFGDGSFKMTKKRCEEFFNEPNNFA